MPFDESLLEPEQVAGGFDESLLEPEVSPQQEELYQRGESLRRKTERLRTAEFYLEGLADPLGTLIRGGQAALQLSGVVSPQAPPIVAPGQRLIPVDAQTLREAVRASPLLSQTALGPLAEATPAPELAQTLSGLTTTESISALPAFAVGGAPAKTALSIVSAQSLVQLPEAVRRVAEAPKGSQEQKQAIADALVTGGMAAAPVLPQAIKLVRRKATPAPVEAVVPKAEPVAAAAAPEAGGPSALPIRETAKVYGNVPEQPGVRPGEVPAESGPERVPPGELRPPGGPPGGAGPEAAGGSEVPLKPVPKGQLAEIEVPQIPGESIARRFVVASDEFKSATGATYKIGDTISEQQVRAAGFEPPPPPPPPPTLAQVDLTQRAGSIVLIQRPDGTTYQAFRSSESWAPGKPTIGRPGWFHDRALLSDGWLHEGEKIVAEGLEKKFGEKVPEGELKPVVEEAVAKRAPVSAEPAVSPAAETAKPAAAPTAVEPSLAEAAEMPAGPGAMTAGERAFRPERGTPLPDFQERPAAKGTFAEPWGFERIPVLGRVIGGVRRLQGYVNESLATYFGERQAGRALASAFGNEFSWLDKPFQIENGQIVNIVPRDPGASRYISDVFEKLQKDPGAYRLNPEQQRAFDAVQALDAQFNRLERKYEVGRYVDDEVAPAEEGTFDIDLAPPEGPYFPRVVVSRPGGITEGLTRGARVGSKPFFEKPRLFDTEAEGWAKGFRYDESIARRLTTRVERLYKRIADKRLATDPALEGISRKELVSQLQEAYADELSSGEWTPDRIENMADSIAARGRVYQPAFYNVIFPEATAKILNKTFPNTQSVVRQTAASVNNALKGLWLGFDWGVGFLQGQIIAARHPLVWARANFNAIQSMFSPDFFPEYVRRNLEPIRELAQLGSQVGHLEEYMAGMGRGELLTGLPERAGRYLEAKAVPGARLVGKGLEATAQVPRAFGRQFQTFLDVAKVEIWKGLRETTPREQWAATVQSIESQLMSASMERIGVSPGRALIERVFLLAPSYYRGFLNNIASLGERGVSGSVARRAMGAYVLGGTVLYYGVAKALGMSDEEILKRFNPARADFLTWKMKVGGKNVEVGVGGIIRSVLRLGGNIYKTSVEHPENWKSLSPEKNPITRFYRGHSGPLIGQIWDQFSGRDYLGQDVDMTGLRRTLYPLTLRTFQQEPGRPKPSWIEAPATFAGLNVFTEPGRRIEAEVRTAARRWMRFHPNPEVRRHVEMPPGAFPPNQYNPLRFALDESDFTAALKEYKKLLVAKGNTADAARQIEREFDYRTAGGKLKPFSDSLAMEPAFYASLSEREKALYAQGLREREQLWVKFQKMFATPARP